MAVDHSLPGFAAVSVFAGFVSLEVFDAESAVGVDSDAEVFSPTVPFFPA